MPQKTIQCDWLKRREPFCRVLGATDGMKHITGSRNRDGNVPNVNFNPDTGKVNVDWNNPDNRNDNIRARAEVSGDSSVSAGLCAYIPDPSVHHF